MLIALRVPFFSNDCHTPLYVPYIVEREFQSQQFLKYKKYLDSIKTNLEDMIRNNLTGDNGYIQKLIGELAENYPSILSESEQIFESWLDSCNAKRFPISGHTLEVEKIDLSGW